MNGGLPNIGDMLNPGALLDPASGLSDTFTVVQQVIQTGFQDIGVGFLFLLGTFFGVNVPAALILFRLRCGQYSRRCSGRFLIGVIDTLVNQPLDNFYVQFPLNQNFLPPADLAEYFALLQSDIQLGVNSITTGFADLAHGVVNEGLQLTTLGSDAFFVELPQSAVLGAVSVLLGG